MNFMRIYIFIISCLLLLSNSANGQKLGYLGSPLSINYGLSTAPNMFMPNARNRSVFSDNSFNFSLISTHSLSVNYQTGRKTVLGATIGYSLTGVDLGRTYTVFDLAGTTPGEITDYTDYKTAFHQLQVFNYEISYTRFAKALAPVGRYWSVYGGIRNTRFRGGELTLEQTEMPNEQIQLNIQSSTGLYAGLELGTQRVLFDKFTLRYGIKLDVLGTLSKYIVAFTFLDADFINDRLAFDLRSNYISLERERFLKDMSLYAKDRAGVQNTILFQVSIGILAP